LALFVEGAYRYLAVTSLQISPEEIVSAAAARAVRRARRRRVLWALTALLALAAGALALWPASDRYRASAVVQVDRPNAQGLPVTTLEYDAQQVTRPDTVSRIVDSVLRSGVLQAHLSATAPSLDVATRRVRDAAELVRATATAAAAHTGAQAAPNKTVDTPPTVTMSAIQRQTIAAGRSPGRLSLAAIMLVLAIAAADAIFLTRVRVPRQLPDATRTPARAPAPERASAPTPEPASAPTPEPSTVPLSEPVVRPVPQPARAAVPNRRRYPRQRRERVAASPLDLPNIEVHLLDREGGLRSIPLRNAAGQATKAQHQREQ
jgi:hypothetical protein